MTDTELFQQSFSIAWSVLERTGELGEPADTTRLGEPYRWHDEARRATQAAAFKSRNRRVQAASNPTCAMIDPDCKVHSNRTVMLMTKS